MLSDSTGNNFVLNSLRSFPHTGILVSSYLGDNKVDAYSRKVGMIFGFASIYPLNSNWGIQSGVDFERKGFTFHASSDLYFRYAPSNNITTNIHTQVDLDYIQIPVLLRYTWDKLIRLSVQTGPYVSFLMNAQVMGTSDIENTYDTGYYAYQVHVNDNVQGAFSKMDLGWVFGIGIEIPIVNKWSVLAEGGYNRGFKDIFSNRILQYSNPNGDNVGYNQTFTCTLGISYHL